jgi:hypothetical protein
MACLPEKSVNNDVKNRVFNRFFPSKKQIPYNKAKYWSQGSLKIRVRCPELRRIGSKPFLWWILKTREKARYRNVIEPLCISCVAESEILRAISCGISAGKPNRCVFTCACGPSCTGLLTTLLSSGNTPGIDYGALAKIQNPWRRRRSWTV